jgi:[ribosomal protein S5]-alanine N-acetyltransferase
MNDGLVLTTERLLLRRLVPDDFDAVRKIHSDPRVMAIYGGVFTEQQTQEFIQRNIDRYAKDGVGLFAITLKDTGDLIGCGGIAVQPTDQGLEPEIGYQMRYDQWRRGYATEMALGCINYAFETMQVDHIISLIRPDNLASRRVAEKNGLKVDREFDWKGQLHLVYRMTKQEWGTNHP